MIALFYITFNQEKTILLKKAVIQKLAVNMIQPLRMKAVVLNDGLKYQHSLILKSGSVINAELMLICTFEPKATY